MASIQDLLRRAKHIFDNTEMKLKEGYYHDKTPDEEAFLFVEKYKEEFSEIPPDQEGYRIWYWYQDKRLWAGGIYYSIVGESDIDEAFIARLHPVQDDPKLAKMLLLGLFHGGMGRIGYL
jgi:hypothetical protein